MVKLTVVCYIVTVLLIAAQVKCGNILFLEGVPSASHHIWNKGLMDILIEKGHNVTALTMENEESDDNLSFIVMEGVYEAITNEWLGTDGVNFKKKSEFSVIKETYDYNSFVASKLVETDGFKRLLNYPDNFKFDLIIHDFTSAQVLLGFVKRFNNPPLVSVSPFGTPPHIYAVSGTPNLPSYNPHFVTVFTNNMGYFDRFQNTLNYVFDWIYRRYFYMRHANRVARDNFGFDITLEEVEQNSSLVLVNSDSSLDYTTSYPPNVREVAGLHTKSQIVGLSEKFLDIIDPVTDKGAYLFTLGANMRSELLGDHIIKMFVEAFRQIPDYPVIWKYEGKAIRNRPPNVHLFDWVPQASLLREFNVKYFITHGGLLGLQEAMWYSTPFIGMPLFMDQHQNVQKYVERGCGIKLDLQNLTVAGIVEALHEIRNTKYENAMEKLSSRVGSNLAHPIDRAYHAIERLLSSKGAINFVPRISKTPFYKLYSIDVYGIFLAITIGYLTILCRNMTFTKKAAADKMEKKKKKKEDKNEAKKNN